MAKHFQVDSGGTLTTGLVSFYQFNGDSTDYFGSNNGSDTSISYSSSGGLIDQYAAFGGAGTITLGTSLLDTVTAGSISVWIYPTASGNHSGSNVWEYTTIISKNQIYIGMLQLDTNKVRYYFFDTGSTARFFDSATSLTLNAWNHIVFTWDNTGSVLYFNGSSDATSALTITNVNSAHSGTTCALGNANPAQAGRYYNGRLDLLGFWSKKLSSSEVTDLYNSGAGNTMVANTAFTKTMSDSVLIGASRTASVAYIRGFVRSVSDSIMRAASRSATVSRLVSYFRAPANTVIMYGASRVPTLAKGLARSISASVMNAASRLATASFIHGFVRMMSDAVVNGASRSATLTRTASYLRSAAASISNAASRLATVTRVRATFANLSDSFMVARGRLTAMKAYVNGLLIQFKSKFTPQGTSFSSKYTPQGTSYSEKFQRQNTVWEDKFH